MYSKYLEPNGTPANDGVVCADSADYSWYRGFSGTPTQTFEDPSHNYAHTKAGMGLGTLLMMGGGIGCWAGPSDRILFDPRPGESPFSDIVKVINGN
jgi:hypothetical protein